MTLALVIGCFVSISAPARPSGQARESAHIGRQDASPADRDAIGNIQFRLTHALAKRDAQEFAGLFLADGIDMPPNRPLVQWRSAIAQDRSHAEPAQSRSFRLLPIETSIQGAMAFQTGTYREGAQVPDDREAADSGKYILIFHKDPHGIWGIAYAIWNSDLAPPSSR